MSTINGSGLATLNRETVSFTPFQGGEYGGRFEGPLAAIEAKYTQLRGRGYAVTLESDSSPIATCIFRSAFSSGTVGGDASGPNADFVDQWEIVRNTVQKELLLSDHPSVAAVNTANMVELKGFIENPGTWDDAEGFTILSGSFTDSAGVSRTNANSAIAADYLFALWRSFVRSVEVKQPILRLTRTTNPFYDAPFNVANVDRVLTTAQMISDSGVPSNFAVPLIELASALTHSTARADGLIVGYGWLKDMVSSTLSGTTRIQYIIEYKFNLWDLVRYPRA